MIDSVDYALAVSIFIAILTLGAVITVGNERVRQATLQVRQVAHEYALADLALRGEQMRRTISFATQAECWQALSQIALDVSGESQEVTNVTVAAGSVAALIAARRDGATCIFTPSAQAFRQANSASARQSIRQFSINGLTSNLFVIAELEAIAHWHGLVGLPRTEEWDLLIVSPADHSLLPKQGLTRWFRFGWN